LTPATVEEFGVAARAEAIEVREPVLDSFVEEMDAANARMAWGSPQAKSWYKNAAGKVTQNWPYQLVNYWARTMRPDPADFRLTKAGEREGEEGGERFVANGSSAA
jgi:4-hydroxyacetophenone monooxygenase